MVGLAAGAISTLGFFFLSPLLEEKAGLGDTCGVHNLHGIPGLLGGLVRPEAARHAWNADVCKTVSRHLSPVCTTTEMCSQHTQSHLLACKTLLPFLHAVAHSQSSVMTALLGTDRCRQGA